MIRNSRQHVFKRSTCKAVWNDQDVAFLKLFMWYYEYTLEPIYALLGVFQDSEYIHKILNIHEYALD